MAVPVEKTLPPALKPLAGEESGDRVFFDKAGVQVGRAEAVLRVTQPAYRASVSVLGLGKPDIRIVLQCRHGRSPFTKQRIDTKAYPLFQGFDPMRFLLKPLR
jgi:hypothetical protein